MNFRSENVSTMLSATLGGAAVVFGGCATHSILPTLNLSCRSFVGAQFAPWGVSSEPGRRLLADSSEEPVFSTVIGIAGLRYAPACQKSLPLLCLVALHKFIGGC